MAHNMKRQGTGGKNAVRSAKEYAKRERDRRKANREKKQA